MKVFMDQAYSEDDRPGSWLFGELSHLFQEDETAACPQCGMGCERMVGGRWSCPDCGGVWSVAQVAQGPNAQEPNTKAPLEASE